MTEDELLMDDDDLFDDTCWNCYGAGGWHECGEDTCCCLDPEEFTEFCDVCEGAGYLGQPELVIA